MSAESPKIDEEYASQRPAYDAFTKTTLELIRRLIEGEGIDIASIESRTKSIESLKGKVERGDKSGKYGTLSDVTDLSGLRIISYLKEDCNRISELMRANFLIDEKNTTFKENDLDPDRFGYQSIHLILSYSPDRLKLPEFKRFSGMKFELQIKTLLQHTWSAIDWKLRYKKTTEAPKRLRRRLFRISALLDAADDELSFVYDQVTDIKKFYVDAISRGDLAIEIDRESIDVYCDLKSSSDSSLSKVRSLLQPTPAVQPQKDADTSANRLIETLKIINIRSIKQLDDRLKSTPKEAIEKFNTAVKLWLANINSTSWSISHYDVARVAISFTSSTDELREILKIAPWAPAMTNAIRSTAGIPEEAAT